ncbi:hypothetical protein BaRGS_00035105 [Batillaria attramentaria]|uniref:Uncharacterized protein n=1 Tax=Batillaria attramentaria TaxID=370345 RepID=A0ABD0JGX2_9CAEN
MHCGKSVQWVNLAYKQDRIGKATLLIRLTKGLVPRVQGSGRIICFTSRFPIETISAQPLSQARVDFTNDGLTKNRPVRDRQPTFTDSETEGITCDNMLPHWTTLTMALSNMNSVERPDVRTLELSRLRLYPSSCMLRQVVPVSSFSQFAECL